MHRTKVRDSLTSLCQPIVYSDLIEPLHRFAEVELVAVLTSLVMRYKVRLTQEMEAEFGGLGLSAWERTEKLLKSEIMLSLTSVA